MVFQTVEIKILKKKSRFKRISHRSIIPKRTWTTLWSNKFPSCFLRSIYLESRNIIRSRRAIREHNNSSQTVVFRMHFPSHESFRVAEGRIKRLDTNGSIRIERKTPISQAMPGHGARFIRPQENGIPALTPIHYSRNYC